MYACIGTEQPLSVPLNIDDDEVPAAKRVKSELVNTNKKKLKPLLLLLKYCVAVVHVLP